MEKLVVFGDSISAGECSENNTSYVDFVKKELDIKYVHNLAVSGTTIGDYSIYPVGPNSLLDMVFKHQEKVKVADTIFIEYGLNDVASLVAGYTTFNKVIVDFIKVIDEIKQLNSTAKIYFIALTENEKCLSKLSENYSNYLNNEYLTIPFFISEPKDILKTYVKLMYYISMCNKIDVIYLLNENDDNFMDLYLAEDGIHPNKEGHKLMADNIIKYM